MKYLVYLCGSIIFLGLVSCSPGNLPYIQTKSKNRVSINKSASSTPLQRIYLIGDAGKLHKSNKKEFRNKVLEHLNGQILNNPSSTVVFLGDNIYPYGFPDSSHRKFKSAQAVLNEQLKAIEPLQGLKVFIPGNHDWAIDQKEGLQYILNQQAFLEQKLHRKTLFPSNGCPGPEAQILGNNVVLITIDTQWWLHPHQKPYGFPCSVYSDNDFFKNLRDTLNKYNNFKKIVVGHHPLISSGSHNGAFGIKKHIFPITDIKKNAYIPLPVLGSLYVAWRSLRGFRQDLNHPRYKILRDSLSNIFSAQSNLLYASGHDHHLGYYELPEFRQILSGSGSKQTKIFKGKKAIFAQSAMGYACLEIYTNYKILTFYSYNTEKQVFDHFEIKID